MTHAELLRSHANLAIKEGGMYYSGEYLSRIAATAESLEVENAKLRELAAKMARALGVNSEWCDRDCEREFGCDCEPCPLNQALRELGIEVD